MKSKEIKERKGSAIKFIIPLVLLILIVLALIGYIVYDKFLPKFNNRPINNNAVLEKFNDDKNTNQIYEDYKILSDDEDSSINYLIGKLNGIWHELDSSINEGLAYEVLGAHNDKLYYSDIEGIKYIDLTKKDFNPVKFAMEDNAVVNNIVFSSINDGKLYIEVNNDPYGHETEKEVYSVIVYDLNSNYIDKKGQTVLTFEETWNYFTALNNKVYYTQGDIMGDAVIKSYDINTKDNITVMNNVCSIDVYKGHLIVTKIDKNSDIERCTDYSIFNPATKNEVKIGLFNYHEISENKLYLQDDKGAYIFNDKTNKADKLFDGYKISEIDDTIYYLSNNKIMKYQNGNSTVLYTGDDNYKMRGFEVYENETFLIYTRKEEYVVKNGKRLKDGEVKQLGGIKVTMKDGSSKMFEVRELVSNNEAE